MGTHAEWKKKNQEITHGLTFISVCQKDAGHEFLLAVRPKGVPDHDLILCQLALQVQGIKPAKLGFSCQKRKNEPCQKYVLERVSKYNL